MWNFREVFLIILSSFANLKLMKAFFFIQGTFLLYKLETFKNCKEVNHIMIMIVTYIFFILCGIWSPVENYFQKILSPHPLKNPFPPFYSPHPPFKSASPLFFDNTPFFQSPPLPSPTPLQKEGGHNVTYFLGNNQVWQFVKFMISST